MGQYLDEWHWTRATHSGFGVGLDSSRAEVLCHYSPYYWPSHDKIKAWLAQWPEWEASPEPPSWFTEEWKGRVLGVVPPELLPAEVRPRAQSFGRMLSAT